jgi:hypothetical protein
MENLMDRNTTRMHWNCNYLLLYINKLKLSNCNKNMWIFQVTIFGHGAGATSVAIHMTSQKSLGLFRSAIVQSLPSCISDGTSLLSIRGPHGRNRCKKVPGWEFVFVELLELPKEISTSWILNWSIPTSMKSFALVLSLQPTFSEVSWRGGSTNR